MCQSKISLWRCFKVLSVIEVNYSPQNPLKNGFILSCVCPLCDHSSLPISYIITGITRKLTPRNYSHSMVPPNFDASKSLISLT